MDAGFFEFWAEVFKNTARGQRQVEDVLKWIRQDLSGYPEFAAQLRRAYGIEGGGPNRGTAAPDPYQETARAFQETLGRHLALFGVAPLSQHQALVRENEELKKKIAAQEEMIGTLRAMLGERLTGTGAMPSGLGELLRLQNEQFRELMRRLGLWPEGESDR
ncbi:MAG: hypothetical protein AB1896_16700 [Thermodesulfobacteriota bacterium]